MRCGTHRSADSLVVFDLSQGCCRTAAEHFRVIAPGNMVCDSALFPCLLQGRRSRSRSCPQQLRRSRSRRSERSIRIGACRSSARGIASPFRTIRLRCRSCGSGTSEATACWENRRDWTRFVTISSRLLRRGPRPRTANRMMQSLLAERFKEQPGFRLGARKGQVGVVAIDRFDNTLAEN